jgi:uncharacterized protein YebE (UPF0316 family)
MDLQLFFSSELFKWIILPLLIFCARIFDVSLGTLRVIFISRGMRVVAAFVGFVEILIWLLAIGQIMKNLTNVVCYIAYAGGFAMGTFVGIYVVEKLSLGVVLIRIITRMDASELLSYLHSENYGVTSVDAQGTTGMVKVIYTVVKRQDLHYVIEIIKKFNPQAFYTIEEVKTVSEGIFPIRDPWYKKIFLNTLGMNRKGK